MPTPTETNPTLHFWDVPAALLGLVIAGVLYNIPIFGRFAIVWMGAPLAMVLLRRTFLPMLTPSETEAAASPSPHSKLGASVLSISGGAIAMIAAAMVFGMMKVGRDDLAWPFLLPVAVGGAMATIGLRRLTHPGIGARTERTEPAPGPKRKPLGQAHRKT